jgi:hypothetical protein
MTKETKAAPQPIEIVIRSGAVSADEVLVGLKSKCEGQPVTFDVRTGAATLRQPDPAVVVAIVAASGVVARTVLKGIFDWVSERQRQTLTIKGIRDGKEFQLVVPLTASNDEIERVIALWQVMAKPQIVLSDDSSHRRK